MPNYSFQCRKCQTEYDFITSYDESGKYKKVKCPKCGSRSKDKLMTACGFRFTNPVGTDRWNSESTGHDYRFKYNAPNVRKERELAERTSHVGSDPYKGTPQDF